MSVTTAAGSALRDGGRELAEQTAAMRARGPRDHAQRQFDDHVRDGSGLTTRLGQSIDVVGVMITLTVAGVIGYIGLTMMDQTESATGFDSGDRANQTAFENASQDLTSGVGTSFGLVEVVFIVLMLAVIITVLVGLRRN